MDVYRCNTCNNTMYVIEKGFGSMTCSGYDMERLPTNIKEYAHEKHIPEVTVLSSEVYVNIGAKNHPMESVHYIKWIAIETTKPVYIHYLHPGDKPFITYRINEDEEILNVYSYCNIHGLWVNNIKL